MTELYDQLLNLQLVTDKCIKSEITCIEQALDLGDLDLGGLDTDEGIKARERVEALLRVAYPAMSFTDYMYLRASNVEEGFEATYPQYAHHHKEFGKTEAAIEMIEVVMHTVEGLADKDVYRMWERVTGHRFVGRYLGNTPRRAECMALFDAGHTLQKVCDALKTSPRLVYNICYRGAAAKHVWLLWANLPIKRVK